MSLRLGKLCLAAGVMAAAGCTSGFYVSESEAAAYGANLRTSTTANDLFSGLRNKVIQVDFAGSGSSLRIAHSNLTETLRAIPNLFVLEQLFRQIRLDRLSAQLEEGIGAWTASRVSLLERGGEGRVRFNPLRRATVRFPSAPVFTYDAAARRIGFEIPVTLTISGEVDVQILSGAARTLFGWLVPDGHYPLSLTIDPLTLRGDILVGQPFAAGSGLVLQVRPSTGTVSVGGGFPSADALRDMVRSAFASPIQQRVEMRYDGFAISGSRLTPRGELDFEYVARPQRSRPVLNVIVADIGTISFTRKGSGDWSPYEDLRMSAGAWPLLAASGPGRLELFLQSGSNQLFHGERRQGRWSVSPVVLSGNPVALSGWTPAFVVTGAGQLEAVVVARDGHLYHLRRKNGLWLAPARIDDSLLTALSVGYGGGDFPLRSPALLQSGDRLLLLFQDNASRLFGAVFDLESGYWGQTGLIRDAGTFQQPAAVTCADGRLDIAYRGRDLVVYHQVGDIQTFNIGPFTGSAFGFSAATRVGDRLTAPPALVCSGYRELEMVGQGTDDALWHVRYNGSSWGPWQEENEHFFGNLFAWKIEGQQTPAGATGDGDVFLVARAAGRDKGVLVHNQYSADRADNTPASLVDWRGFARVSDREFFGTPSLAIQGRELALVTRGADGNVWQSTLGDALRADLRRVNAGALQFPFEAAIVSGGPRTLEILYPATDGTVRHVRRLNGFDQRERSLSAPVPISPIAATGFAGQIELVGLGRDHNLYHWRFLRGAWSDPVAVGGPAYSAPALVATGSGQLEVFAVGADLRLQRWRFADARWSDLGPVAPGLRTSAVGFGPSSASGSEDGSVDVAFVEEGTGAVFYGRVAPPAAPSPILALGGLASIPFARVADGAVDPPLVASLSWEGVHLVVPRADGVFASQTYRAAAPASRPSRTGLTISAELPTFQRPLLLWEPFRKIAGAGLLLGSLVPLGDGEIALAAADRSGRISLGRFADGRWGMFLPIVGQSPSTIAGPPVRPALAVK